MRENVFKSEITGFSRFFLVEILERPPEKQEYDLKMSRGYLGITISIQTWSVLFFESVAALIRDLLKLS